VEMPVDGRIALAAAVLQALDIEHLDAAAAIADQARLLQLARDEGDAKPRYRPRDQGLPRPGAKGVVITLAGRISNKRRTVRGFRLSRRRTTASELV
jgi:hypothetical protein